jgi:hypothetical protein
MIFTLLDLRGLPIKKPYIPIIESTKFFALSLVNVN